MKGSEVPPSSFDIRYSSFVIPGSGFRGSEVPPSSFVIRYSLFWVLGFNPPQRSADKGSGVYHTSHSANRIASLIALFTEGSSEEMTVLLKCL